MGVKKPSNQNDYIGQSGRADRLIDDHFRKHADENVLVQARDGGSATGPQSAAAVGQVMAAVSHEPGVTAVKSPYLNGNEGQISKDGRSVLVRFKVNGDQDRTDDLIDPIVASVDKVKAANPGVFVGQFGDASANKALSKSFQDDFQKAEKLSLPITLVILVLAFGALVAAGVPLLLGLTAVMATLGLVALPSQIIPMDDTVSSIILLVGLAVGVDYTLFYLRREREEQRARRRQARGHPHGGGDLGPGGARLRLHRHGRHGRACSSPASARSPRSASARSWSSPSR